MKKDLIKTAEDNITNYIFIIRGKKVMFDRDLAYLYGVETRALNQAVKRNRARFPVDFMFQISKKEFENLRSQFVISDPSNGGQRYLPYVFTELGIAMVSSVLKSEKAVQMNIQIMRTFTRLRQMVSNNENLADKVADMEKRYDAQIEEIIEAIEYLVEDEEEQEPKSKIGFMTD